VTNNERELVAVLESDIEIWESLVRYVERSSNLHTRKKSDRYDTRGMRERIVEHRVLKVKPYLRD